MGDMVYVILYMLFKQKNPSFLNNYISLLPSDCTCVCKSMKLIEYLFEIINLLSGIYIYIVHYYSAYM